MLLVWLRKGAVPSDQEKVKINCTLVVDFEDNAGWWRIVALCRLLIGGSDIGDSESGNSFKSSKFVLHLLLLRLVFFYSLKYCPQGSQFYWTPVRQIL